MSYTSNLKHFSLLHCFSLKVKPAGGHSLLLLYALSVNGHTEIFLLSRATTII